MSLLYASIKVQFPSHPTASVSLYCSYSLSSIYVDAPLFPSYFLSLVITV